jgi:hypothetical protein
MVIKNYIFSRLLYSIFIFIILRFMDVNGLIRHNTGFCIEMLEDKTSIIMTDCNQNNERQKWFWKNNKKLKTSDKNN